MTPESRARSLIEQITKERQLHELERQAFRDRATSLVGPIESFLQALRSEIPNLGRNAEIKLSGWSQKSELWQQEITLHIDLQEPTSVDLSLLAERFHIGQLEFVLPDEIEKAEAAIASIVHAYFSPHTWS